MRTRPSAMVKLGFLVLLCFLLEQTACNLFEGGLSDKATTYPLLLRFYADRSRAFVGEPIHMRFTITNMSQQPWIEESQDTPVMDIVVSSYGSGKVFLTWSAQNPDKVAHRLEWKPGESKTIEMVWTPKQEDITIGVFHNVHLAGILNKDSRIVQSASVDVCASNVCGCGGLFCLP